MTAPIPNASKPPFTLARELYSELFEADNPETAMWHFSQMKPSEQRFIQAHLLFLLLHGQAVTNLNLRDIRERTASIELRLQELEPADDVSLEGREGEAVSGSPEGDRENEDPRQMDAGDEDDDEEDEASDEPDERRSEVANASEARLSPQLEAAVSALEEALSFDSSAEEAR